MPAVPLTPPRCTTFGTSVAETTSSLMSSEDRAPRPCHTIHYLATPVIKMLAKPFEPPTADLRDHDLCCAEHLDSVCNAQIDETTAVDEAGVPTGVIDATTELIAACELLKKKRSVAIPTRLGVGRAGRAARARHMAASRVMANAPITIRDLKRIRKAREDLLDASSKDAYVQQDYQDKEIYEQQMQNAATIQNKIRGWQAQELLLKLRTDRAHQELKLQEQQEELKTQASVRKESDQQNKLHPDDSLNQTEAVISRVASKQELDEIPTTPAKPDEERAPLEERSSVEVQEATTFQDIVNFTNQLLEVDAPESVDSDMEHFDPEDDYLSKLLSKTKHDAFFSRGKSKTLHIDRNDRPFSAYMKIAQQEREQRASNKEQECVEKDSSEWPKPHFPERAAASLRRALHKTVREYRNMQEPAIIDRTTSNLVCVTSDLVRKQYLESCTVWNVKPNSRALASFNSAEVSECAKGIVEVEYDFSMAHLGDRGVVCVLHALAMDPYCVRVSLQSCGLRGSSAPAVAAFLELHPRLCHMDLSHNSFSYQTGELLLEALTRRCGLAPGDDIEVSHNGHEASHNISKLHKVTIDLGGTALAWDRGGPTVGPPSGNLWAGHGDSRSRFAPSGYETLRSKLDETQHIHYASYGDGRIPSVPEINTEVSNKHHMRRKGVLPLDSRQSSRMRPSQAVHTLPHLTPAPC